MTTTINPKKAAQEFADWWKGKGYEKGETQTFWNSLLQEVFGIKNYKEVISYESRVKLNKTSFMDAYILPTRVLIEQKSISVDLRKPVPQSDGSKLTPFEQAKRYNNELGFSQKARWIVICNFREFHIYDMETMNPDPEIVKLEDLPKDLHRLQFLVDNTVTNIQKEEQVSLKAGEIVGVLYDKFAQKYEHLDDPEEQQSLNRLCVCLVFCLYAEDADIFGKKNMFHDYMAQFPAAEFHSKLEELFRVLNTKPEHRRYLRPDLAAFPYVNGGLFSGDITIPLIDDEIRTLILQRASDDFDWSEISPTIFGAVFESTLNPETRRKGGMHYTSVENIHKVIDPLFLDDLKAELAAIKAISVLGTKRKKAAAFQKKLAGLKFFDPACGSGNFLTEAYISLRRLENEVIPIINKTEDGQLAHNFVIQVSINQFYGIEINDFACSVAQTALWIAELQMLQETNKIVGSNLDPLPLKTYTNIHEGNALRMDWNEVVPATELNYIMGNPPFVGAHISGDERKKQKADLLAVFGKKWKKVGELDYVAGWYKKSQEMMVENSTIRAALVSTNSITQGEQVGVLWKPLMESGVHIDFAWRSFIWDGKARVHCVIVGFSMDPAKRKRIIFDGNTVCEATNINAYLIDYENVFVLSRANPLCDVPQIGIGNKPIDNQNYLFKETEKDAFVQKEPASEKYFKRWYGAEEFINSCPRWCLWLGDADPVELSNLPECMKRVMAVREFRLRSTSAGTVKLADRPTRFHVENVPKGNYLLIPRVSSEKRLYVPIGFMNPDVLCSDSAHLIPNATLYHFGVLTSIIHNAWMRVVGGRLESRYRYSKEIVYNNFPWPTPTQKQREKIEKTAQMILDAREHHSKATLHKLYGNMIVFSELWDAHRANDAAVMEAYGFDKNLTETEIVTRLFQLYQNLTAKNCK